MTSSPSIDRDALIEDASTREDLLLAAGVSAAITKDAMAEIGVNPDNSAVFTDPTAEQRERAAEPPAGMKGKALARYILIGPEPLDDDATKQAEALSVDNGGATVQHDPATGDLSVQTTLGTVLSGVARRDIAAQVLADNGLEDGTRATDEQIKRSTSKAKPGLKGKARATWIITGQDIQQQAAAAKTKRGAKGATKTTGDATTTTSSATTTPRGPREGSALHAAVTILADASEALSAQEIYDRAKAKCLAGGLKGKTPVATLAAQLATANKKGQYVERPAPGRYQLRKAGE